jgi:hypothetical protein
MTPTTTNAIPHEIDMMVQSKAIGAQTLAKVLREILDLEDDEPLPLALAKSKINTVEMLLDLTAANIDGLTYNKQTDPKKNFPWDTRHSSRSSRRMFHMNYK